jgi:hypothetical protein
MHSCCMLSQTRTWVSPRGPRLATCADQLIPSFIPKILLLCFQGSNGATRSLSESVPNILHFFIQDEDSVHGLSLKPAHSHINGLGVGGQHNNAFWNSKSLSRLQAMARIFEFLSNQAQTLSMSELSIMLALSVTLISLKLRFPSKAFNAESPECKSLTRAGNTAQVHIM